MPRGVYNRSKETIEHLRNLANNRDDEWRRKQSECRIGKVLSEETKDKMSKTHTERYKDPNERRKTSIAMSGLKRSEETKERMRKPKTEEHKQKIRESKLGHTVSEETREKISTARTGVYCLDKHPNWQGGKSFEPYCPKFNESLRTRVRAFFKYTCQICGAVQKEPSLHVHHVAYDKQTCCNDTPPMFVPLCQKCHLATNNHRGEFEKKFVAMITEKYQGRSYFTVEEWNEINGISNPATLSSSPQHI
jgi:5-methylcytosine-specific restriction endonuclease McrA